MLIIANWMVFFAVAMPVQSVVYGVDGQVTAEGIMLLKSVPVRLEGLDARFFATDYTDAAGRFHFAQVPSGSYYVIVSLEGFEEVRERVVVPQVGNTWILVKRKIARPPDGSDVAIGGLNTVNVRQLSIPREAVHEYEEALEAEKDGNVVRAIERLHNAIDMAPEFYEAAVELARVHIDRKEFDAAVHVLRSNLPADSTVAGAAFYLGYALHNLKQYDAAEEALATSLESEAYRPTARLVLANLFIRTAQLEKALDQIDAYLEENPDSEQRGEVDEKRSELMRFLNRESIKE